MWTGIEYMNSTHTLSMTLINRSSFPSKRCPLSRWCTTRYSSRRQSPMRPFSPIRTRLQSSSGGLWSSVLSGPLNFSYASSPSTTLPSGLPEKGARGWFWSASPTSCGSASTRARNFRKRATPRGHPVKAGGGGQVLFIEG